MPAMQVRELKAQIAALPRIALTDLPTPLEELKRLSGILAGPRLLIKRDDLTTLALGGNKTRKIEFALGQAQHQGADTIVTGGARQSNHCRLTAAAAAKMGLDCVLVVPGNDDGQFQGNLLLDKLFGAELLFAGDVTSAEVDLMIPKVTEQLRVNGRHPYAMQVAGGPDSVHAVIGYISAYIELSEQLNQIGVKASHLCVCSGSGATQAGLLMGARLLGHQTKVLGISIKRSAGELETLIRKNIKDAGALLGSSVHISEDDVIVNDELIHPGFGVLTPDLMETISLLAQTSGILIDPIYAGKALAGLFHMVKDGTLGKQDVVVFVHTGGIPSLFDYADHLVDARKAAPSALREILTNAAYALVKEN